jgi:hypothetical protein
VKPTHRYASAVLCLLFGIAATTGPLTTHAAELVFGQVASLSNPTSASNARGLIAGIAACFEAINAKGGVSMGTSSGCRPGMTACRCVFQPIVDGVQADRGRCLRSIVDDWGRVQVIS